MTTNNTPQNLPKVICSSSPKDFGDFFKVIFGKYAQNNPDILFIDLGNQSISYSTLINQQRIETNSIVVYGGHGEATALRLENTEFYNADHFDKGPSAICAFACSSGSILGENFVKETGGGYFGYDDDIDFVTAPEFHSLWEKIFHPIISIIFSEQEINSVTVEKVKNIYQDVISEIDDKNDNLRLLRMILEYQMEMISKY